MLVLAKGKHKMKAKQVKQQDVTMLNRKQFALLEALRSNAETISTEIATGKQWGTVYIDNARNGYTPRQFAQALSVFKRLGLYEDYSDRQYKGVFGKVYIMHVNKV